MQLKYGTYAFDVDSLWPQWQREVMRDEAGRPYAERHVCTVRGFLAASGQAAITTAIKDLQAALKTNYKDLIFYQTDGAKSAHLLTQADSISGVVITAGPEFTGTYGAEYATQREFTFTAEADYALPNTQLQLISFQESLMTMGGLPLYVCREALNGVPQRQLVYPSTTYTAVQSGRAIGFKRYPTPPSPMFPFALRGGRDGMKITKDTPSRRGVNFINFGVTWEYLFESPAPLVGRPNLWRD